MKAVHLDLHPRQIMTFNRERRIHASLLAGIFCFITLLHITLLPMLPLDGIRETGFVFDLLNLLPLAFLFWVVQCAHLDPVSYRLLSSGLMLWLSGTLVDVLDELFLQPLPVGLFVEDPLRVLGLVLCVIGLTRTMFYVCSIYNQLHGLALSDDLTRLPNRRRFRLTLDATPDMPGSVMMIDLDFFKRINDTYGHDVGDLTLQQFGHLLLAICPQNALVARLGGEEFALFTPEVAVAPLQALAEQIRQGAHCIQVAPTHHLTVSLGIGIRELGESNTQLLSRVDQALYRAKENGRDRIEWSGNAGAEA